MLGDPFVRYGQVLGSTQQHDEQTRGEHAPAL